MRSNQENFEGKSRVIKRFFENSKVQGCCGKDRGGNRLNFCREEFSNIRIFQVIGRGIFVKMKLENVWFLGFETSMNFYFKIYPIRFEDIIIIRNFIDECLRLERWRSNILSIFFYKYEVTITQRCTQLVTYCVTRYDNVENLSVSNLTLNRQI